eukprot:gene29907-37318_t
MEEPELLEVTTARWPFAWLLWPVTFSLSCWFLAFNQHIFLAALPDPQVWWLLGTPTAKDLALSLKDLLPTTTADAYELGKLANELGGLPQENLAEPLLRRAQEILNTPTLLTRDNLEFGVAEAVAQASQARSPLAKIFGLFSVVNLAALLAIGGILFSFGPTLGMVARPLIKFLDQLLKPLLEKIGEFVSNVLTMLLVLARLLRPLGEPAVWLS